MSRSIEETRDVIDGIDRLIRGIKQELGKMYRVVSNIQINVQGRSDAAIISKARERLKAILGIPSVLVFKLRQLIYMLRDRTFLNKDHIIAQLQVDLEAIESLMHRLQLINMDLITETSNLLNVKLTIQQALQGFQFAEMETESILRQTMRQVVE